ncbi:MAG: GNAT family N-acetyltransferase [Ardenticatenia bacterium]|nr:GNAT family N-acetyltransferase [Ardenticatenia bacterium]
MGLVIRTARSEDAAAAVALINGYADRDLMLPRRLEDVMKTLPNWLVAVERDGEGGETVLGCGALAALTPDLAELRSLAVHADAQGRGVGSLLVAGLVSLAGDRDFAQVCALTLREAFFNHLGFDIVDRWSISPKLWQECIYCPKFDRCDEVAVLRTLRLPARAASGPTWPRVGHPLLKWPAWQPLRLAYCCQPLPLDGK